MKISWKHVHVLLAAARLLSALGLICISLQIMYRVHVGLKLEPHPTPEQWHHVFETKSLQENLNLMMSESEAWVGLMNALFDFGILALTFGLLFFGLQILEFIAFRSEHRASQSKLEAR